MSMKFYIDNTGKYLGAYSEGNPSIPNGAIEVSSAPNDARQTYDINNGVWSDYIETYKEEYMEQRALYYPYKTTVITMTDGARADLIGMYFDVKLDLTIPDSKVMASWREVGYSPLSITAGDLRADGKKFAEHRQKCFAALTLLNGTQYNTKQEVETAFDNFYNAV
jgi:hypothetical protein